MELNFTQQETKIIYAEGKRWIKCEFCGKIAKKDEFCSFGVQGRINLGTCKDCSRNNPAVELKLQETYTNVRSNRISEYDPNTCPECGDQLRERGGPYGRFIGCSNFPSCRYSRKIPN